MNSKLSEEKTKIGSYLYGENVFDEIITHSIFNIVLQYTECLPKSV